MSVLYFGRINIIITINNSYNIYDNNNDDDTKLILMSRFKKNASVLIIRW